MSASRFVDDPDVSVTSDDADPAGQNGNEPNRPLVPDIGETQIVSIDEVKPAEKNPRKIPMRAIEIVGESLKRFGWQQPLVVDRQGILIVGHTRHQAARALGLTHVPVIVAENLTDDEVKAYRIADNRTHDFTTWDLPELVSQLDSLDGDFSDVLGLEDWRTLVDEFEDMSLNISPDAAADMGGNGFEITVVFKDKPAGLAVEQQLFDLPGVLDVRHKFKG